MGTPDWLDVGASVRDPDDERWTIREVGPAWVAVQHPERGVHRLLKDDLVAWVEDGDWNHSG